MRMSPDITRQLLDLVPKSGVLLDVGCGDLTLLQEVAGRGHTLLATDPVTPDRVPEGVLFRPGRAEAIPFPDETADVIIMQCVFSLCRPEDTVSELARVLKPGGILILSDLFSANEDAKTTSSALLGRLDSRPTLEAYFAGKLQQDYFLDVSGALTHLLAQAILDGDADQCVSCADLAVLKKAKARYGVWQMSQRDVLSDSFCESKGRSF